MKALANMLGILSVKQAPSVLKTDELIPVIAADAGWAAYEPFSCFFAGEVTAVFGGGSPTSLADFYLAIPDNGLPPGYPFFAENNAGYETVILGYSFGLNWNAAAAAADAGRYINSSVVVEQGTNFPTIGSLRRSWQVSVADPGVFFGSSCNSPGALGVTPIQQLVAPIWVPAGTGLIIQIFPDDGAPFANGGANSIGFTCRAFGVQRSQGVKTPFLSLVYR